MTSSAFNTNEIQDVLQHFEFYQGTLDELSVVPQRLTNQNARFRIGDKQWVIKRYDADNAPKNLALSHELQKHLASEGFPAAKLELTKNGESLVRRGQHLYSVHQWIRGRHHNHIETGETISEKLICEVAANLGRFHCIASKHYESRIESDLANAKALLQSPLENANAICAKNRLGIRGDSLLKWKLFKSPMDRWLLTTFPKFQRLAEQLARIPLAQGSALQEVVLTHNDINWLNLIFDDHESLIAIIDFDNIQFAPRQAEIGSAALVVAGGNTSHRSLFLEHYERSSGLSVDPEAVRISMLVRSARSFLWSMQAYRSKAVNDIDMLSTWMHFLDSTLDQFISDPDFRHLLQH
ncbi:MAG: phosphotransferase [Ketobacter sp.]|nr:phosphotransferase [Ketobacter sp.]